MPVHVSVWYSVYIYSNTIIFVRCLACSLFKICVGCIELSSVLLKKIVFFAYNNFHFLVALISKFQYLHIRTSLLHSRTTVHRHVQLCPCQQHSPTGSPSKAELDKAVCPPRSVQMHRRLVRRLYLWKMSVPWCQESS